MSQVTVNLKRATKKLEEATKEFEQATELRQALEQAGVLNTGGLRAAQEAAVTEAKARQRTAAEKVARAQESVLTEYKNNPPTPAEAANLNDERTSALAALMKVSPVPPPVFDTAKMIWVAGFLAAATVAVVVFLLTNPDGKATAIVGLLVAAIGQLFESLKKADDAEKYPRIMDVLDLSGEALKIFGVLAALVGAVLGT